MTTTIYGKRPLGGCAARRGSAQLGAARRSSAQLGAARRSSAQLGAARRGSRFS